jgi:hypothetical protein
MLRIKHRKHRKRHRRGCDYNALKHAYRLEAEIRLFEHIPVGILRDFLAEAFEQGKMCGEESCPEN